ncbi:hypothetical protein ADIS_2225 [Lunatimonas lonarensis]|uniref:Uncharacterized protein n=1 Tax=Lunatimonas lonarensis TaxID=1232681 RepID=R7ZTE7_9BACT|nr:hypothetical protein ADIS_2225 [Lunatimonas lonarensis]
MEVELWLDSVKRYDYKLFASKEFFVIGEYSAPLQPKALSTRLRKLRLVHSEPNIRMIFTGWDPKGGICGFTGMVDSFLPGREENILLK